MKLRQLLALLAENEVPGPFGRGAWSGHVRSCRCRLERAQIDGTTILVLTLDGLEASKRAAGRPKDLVDLGYIHALKTTPDV